MEHLAITLNTRKPVSALTPDDLAAFPVWEFALDEEGAEGRDETSVRPLNARVVPRNRHSMQVATEFRAACGRTYAGLSIVSTVRGHVEIDAGILLHGADYLPTDDPEALMASTGLNRVELLPITYRLRVPIEGEREPRSGTLSALPEEARWIEPTSTSAPQTSSR
jgi:hypothetical protein